MKTKLLFSISLISLFTAACSETEEIVEPKEVARLETGIENLSYITSSDGRRNNLYAEERIEPSLSGQFPRQSYTSYAFGVTGSIARSGSRSTRFELRNEGSAIRSEAYWKEYTPENGWYGMSYYLPSDSWVTDDRSGCWDIITQFHGTADSGESGRVPAISFSVIRGRFQLAVNWTSQRIANKPQGTKTFDLGPVIKDRWLDIVYHVKHSYRSDGVVEMWINGKKVVDYDGPNTYNDSKLPMLKMGIYKRNWYRSNKRVIYIDDIRVGGAGASYNDVAPSGSGGSSLPVDNDSDKGDDNDNGGDTGSDNDTPSSSGQKVESFTLINADTDQPIQTLANGAVLDLSELPTKNLNIRANTNSNDGGVMFNLTGAKSHYRNEGTAPYAVFGDTNGDYKPWVPVTGRYNLKATASSGIVTNISFTVEN